jgi:hypothetical protein
MTDSIQYQKTERLTASCRCTTTGNDIMTNRSGTPSTATRRGALLGIAVAGLGAGATTSALALPSGTPGPEIGTALSDSLASLAGQSGADPVFALIARHRAALKAYCDACEAGAEETKSQNDGADDHLVALLTARPTTVAGAVALLDHVSHAPFLDRYPMDEDDTTMLADALDGNDVLKGAAERFPATIAAALRDMNRVARSADAELLAMAPQFEALYEQWKTNTVAEHVSRKKFQAEVERRTGIAYKDAPRPHDDDDPYWQTWQQVSDEMHGDDPPEDEDGNPPRTFMDDLHDMARKILAYRPITVAGLRLQTLALASSWCEVWESGGDLDDPEAGPGGFLASVAAFCGVEWPPYELPHGDAGEAVSS